MTAGANTPFRFSTEDVPVRDRLAVWREVLGRYYLHLDVEPVAGGRVRATAETHRWSTASLYFSDTTPVCATRTAQHVQDDGGDFRLLQAEGAPYRFTARGFDSLVPQGGAALLYNGAISRVCYLGPCRVTGIRIRRDDLKPHVRNLDERAFRPVESGSATLRLLNNYVAVLRREGPSSDPILAARVASHLTDLVALALGATRDAAEVAQGRGLRAARLAAIKADIDANICEPGLSVETAAARQGVSPRYVQVLFESEALTFTEYLVARRLARAYRMLTDPGFAVRTISSIAFDAGFGDLSYFNRTFRRLYGATPTDVRAGARSER